MEGPKRKRDPGPHFFVLFESYTLNLYLVILDPLSYSSVNYWHHKVITSKKGTSKTW
jgi:hypothetical protein